MTDAVDKRFSRGEWQHLIQDRSLARNIIQERGIWIRLFPARCSSPDFIDSIDPKRTCIRD